jgi:hypothetical protein
MGADEFIIMKPGDLHADTLEPPLVYVAIDFRIQGRSPGSEGDALFKEKCIPSLQKDGFPGIYMAISWSDSSPKPPPRTIIAPHIQDAVMEELFWHLVGRFHKTLFLLLFRSAALNTHS